MTGRSGSMTGLPIVETKANDVSAHILTNVIPSLTARIFLQSDLFNGPTSAPAVDARYLRLSESVLDQGSEEGLRTLKISLGTVPFAGISHVRLHLMRLPRPS